MRVAALRCRAERVRVRARVRACAHRSAVFCVDIVLNFYVPYKTSLKLGGIVVYDQRRIAKHYLSGWFTFDVLTCVPFDLFFGLLAVAQGWQHTAAASQLIPLLRILRMVKLLRIVRAARIIRRWQDHIAISFALLSLIKFTLLTCLLAHWLGAWAGFECAPLRPLVHAVCTVVSEQ